MSAMDGLVGRIPSPILDGLNGQFPYPLPEGLVSRIHWFAPDWSLTSTVRYALVNQLLTFLGLPIALFITLTSLALPSLSSYANGSLLLLHGRYPVTSRERRWGWVIGRQNAFHDALQIALFVAATLVALAALRNFTLLDGHPIADGQMPTLVVVVVLAALEVLLLIRFVFWVIRLRQPTEVIQHLQILADNALAHVRTPGERFRRAQRSEIYGQFTCELEEQEEVKQIALALSQTTLRAVHDHQPFSAYEGVAAMKKLYELAHDGKYPAAWQRMRAVQGQLDDALTRIDAGEATVAAPTAPLELDWLSQLVIEGLAEVLTAAAERGSILVGKAAAGELERIASDLLAKQSARDRSDADLLKLALEKHAEAFASCLLLGDRRLRDALLDQLRHLVADLAAATGDKDASKGERAREWALELRSFVRVHGTNMAEACVARGDVGALRGVLDLLRRVGLDHPDLRATVATAALNVGATALALREDVCASVIAAWIPGAFDPAAEVVPGEAIRLIQAHSEAGGLLGSGASDEPSNRRSYVGVDYVAVLVVLACGRGIQFGHEGWKTASKELAPVVKGSADVRNARDRCAWVCERVGEVAHLAKDEREAWLKAVRDIVT
jgi:hypothetical protein